MLPQQHSGERSQLAAHIATGAAALARSRSEYQRDPKGVALLARTVQALIVVDQSFPLGLQRMASLEWPDDDVTGSGDRVDRELTQHLALENEQERSARRALQGELDTANQEAREQRTAVWLGQCTATLGPVLGLAATAWYLLELIGWETVGGLLANLAIVASAMAALLGGWFKLLSRHRLLMGAAERGHRWMSEKGIPLLTSTGKIKRG
jgi:hypothetical protein